MEFSYGPGIYIEGNTKIRGQIILGSHKLFLKDESGDLVQTYVPIEKIIGIKKRKDGLEIHTRPSVYYRYVVLLQGDRKLLNELCADLSRRRGFKKRFFKNEWVDQSQ